MNVIEYTVDGHLATVRINRPEKKNAMTFAMLRDFLACFAEADADDQVRAVLLTGVSGAFCAGTDLSDLSDRPVEERGAQRTQQTGTVGSIVGCRKPVVAAVDGPAVGMGAEFVSMADVRFASTNARFGWVFVHRGLVADTGAGTWLLPRLVGPQVAARLLFGGQIISAEEALRIGFVAEVLDPSEVEERARREALDFTVGSPFAVQRTKKLLVDGLGRDFTSHYADHTRLLQECFSSEDHREGVSAFLERREPRFTGR